MTFGGEKFIGWGKIVGAVFIIVSSSGCIAPPIDNAASRIPPRDSPEELHPAKTSPAAPTAEERGETAADGLAAAERQDPIGDAEDMLSLKADVVEDDATDFNGGKSTAGEKEATLIRAFFLCRLSQTEWKRGETEEAIEALDQAYALLLRVDPEDDPVLSQEKEHLRVVISRRMLEIYSSRIVAVTRETRNEIPVPINKHVQAEIGVFTSGREKDFFLSAYRRSGRYREKIEAALQAAGLPLELAWLPLVESGFKVTALSPARALGLWQFIPSTGYRYGLNRDTYIDERLDPEKSTRSAIDYLRELHEMFGDWTTVLAAYNCGEHRVLRTIQNQHINYLDNFWDLYERLPRETARYVPRFLATLHIVRNPEKYGLEEVAVDPPLLYETVAVSKQTSLKSIAQATGIDGGLLRELNAELRRGILPADGYDLRVPLAAGRLVTARINDFEIARIRPEGNRASHRVRRGENLSSIGKRYGVSVKTLMAANGIRTPKRLRAGTVLRIPRKHSFERHAHATKSPARTSTIITYVVRPGDSLFKIAKRFATTTEKIQRLNQMSTTVLSVGQILKIQTEPGFMKEA